MSARMLFGACSSVRGAVWLARCRMYAGKTPVLVYAGAASRCAPSDKVVCGGGRGGGVQCRWNESFRCAAAPLGRHRPKLAGAPRRAGLAVGRSRRPAAVRGLCAVAAAAGWLRELRCPGAGSHRRAWRWRGVCRILRLAASRRPFRHRALGAARSRPNAADRRRSLCAPDRRPRASARRRRRQCAPVARDWLACAGRRVAALGARASCAGRGSRVGARRERSLDPLPAIRLDGGTAWVAEHGGRRCAGADRRNEGWTPRHGDLQGVVRSVERPRGDLTFHPAGKENARTPRRPPGRTRRLPRQRIPWGVAKW